MSNNKLITILLVLIGILFYFKDSPFLRFVLIPIVKQNDKGYEYMDKQVDIDKTHQYLEDILQYIEQEGFTLTGKEKDQIRYCFSKNEEMNSLVQEKIKTYISKNMYSSKIPHFLNEMDKFFIRKIDRPNPPKVLYSNWYRQKYEILIELLLTVTSSDKILNLESFYDGGLRNSFLKYKIVNLDIPRDVNEAEKIGSVILGLPKYFISRSIYGEEKVSQALAAQHVVTLFLQNYNKREDLHLTQLSFLKKAPKYLFDFPKPGTHVLKSFEPATFLADNVQNDEFRKIILQKSSEYYRVELDKALKNETIFKKIDSILLSKNNFSVKSEFNIDTELKDIFHKIDIIFSKYPPKLSKGLSDNQIIAIQQALSPHKLPNDIIAFYKWHNGLQLDSVTVFEPIRSVLYGYYLNISMKNEIFWKDEYLPLHSFGSSGDEFIKLEGVDESPIYDYDYSEYSPVKFASIKKMMQLFLEVLEAKIIYYNDDNGKWEGDEVKLEYFMNERQEKQ